MGVSLPMGSSSLTREGRVRSSRDKSRIQIVRAKRFVSITNYRRRRFSFNLACVSRRTYVAVTFNRIDNANHEIRNRIPVYAYVRDIRFRRAKPTGKTERENRSETCRTRARARYNVLCVEEEARVYRRGLRWRRGSGAAGRRVKTTTVRRVGYHSAANDRRSLSSL